MKHKILLIILGTHIVMGSLSPAKKKLKVPDSKDKKCSNIQCLAIENPVCARVTTGKQKRSKVIHVIMVNECEMEYMKCHQGFQGTIVPMANCKHEEYNTVKNIMKQRNSNEDRNQYQAECPTVCPSRDVMVCGRCQHGVYKTFLSVCHLRMFQCQYADEGMELVSRYPCIMSAPYLSEDSQPKGRVSEPDDEDVVLQFIMCRENGITDNNLDNQKENGFSGVYPNCNFFTHNTSANRENGKGGSLEDEVQHSSY